MCLSHMTLFNRCSWKTLLNNVRINKSIYAATTFWIKLCNLYYLWIFKICFIRINVTASQYTVMVTASQNTLTVTTSQNIVMVTASQNNVKGILRQNWKSECTNQRTPVLALCGRLTPWKRKTCSCETSQHFIPTQSFLPSIVRHDECE
jgi:hypothetical protein